jgi:glutamyl-tRNA synthetase
LKLPLAGPITFRDELRGDVTRDATDLDDQVLMKSDGLPTYHLANVVDDHLMEITHVVRAEEWISSTPKHVVLYQAFGWELPKFFHMSLLRNNDKDKTKVSKRKQPTSINYYKDIGIFPEAMLNFLGTMGWSLGDGKTEVFSLAEMIAQFSWDKISLGGPVFNLEKLTWMNEQYVHAMSIEQLADRLIAWRLNKEFLVKVLPLVHKRTKKLDEVVPQIEYFFAGDLDYAPVIADMKIEGVAPADLAKALLAFVEKFEARDFTVAILTEEANAWAAAHTWTTKQAFPLLRFAVTARKASPPLFETMEVLGKEITRRRIRRAVEVLASGGKITR